jgi:peptide/nickel transport system substrate-binding protein
MRITYRLVLTAAALVAATAGGAQAQTPSALKVVPYADLRNIDPIWTTASVTNNHAYLIYDVLFALDDQFRAQPQMVESVTTSADGLTHTFKLRPGQKWHDGAPVTSADCIQSIKRWGQRDDEGKVAFSLTAELSAVDERTFVWKFKERYGALFDNLAKGAGLTPFMMPERVAKTDAFTQITENIGSGPFRFKADEWAPGNKVVYTKNPDYIPRGEPPSLMAGGKIPKVDRIEWIYIPDGATAVSALNAGEVDYVEVPPADLVPILERNPDVVVKSVNKLGSMVIIRPNQLHPPFNNPKARQALMYLTDQDDYMNAIGVPRAYFDRCGSFFYCGTPYESKAGNLPLGGKANYEKAKQLMQEAGYKGETVVILHPTDHPTAGAALLTAENLRKIGVNVQLRALDWATLTSLRTNKGAPTEGGWSIFHTRWDGMLSNPLSLTPMGGACDKAWFGWPCDPEIEKMRVAWSRAPDKDTQKKLIDDMQARMAETVPFINTGGLNQPAAWRKTLDGVLVSTTMVLWNISKK